MWIVLFMSASLIEGHLNVNAAQTLEAFAGKSFESRNECQTELVKAFQKGLTPEYKIKSNERNGYIWLERPAYQGIDKLQCTEITLNK
jgi:hypothetical protein